MKFIKVKTFIEKYMPGVSRQWVINQIGESIPGKRFGNVFFVDETAFLKQSKGADNAKS